MKSRIIYGPILSRRLGRSLGIDVIKKLDAKKNCNFDCVYCQLGHVDKLITDTENIKGLVSVSEVVEGLTNYHKNVEDLDYITFSGTCEPTLNPDIGEMIRQIRKISNLPVCVITNSSLISQKRVRDNLCEADLVVATLVSSNEDTFQAINRPAAGIHVKEIIQGLKELKDTGTCKLAIEVMLLDSTGAYPVNSTDKEVDELITVLRYIDPDEIEVLTTSRPPAEDFIVPVSDARLKEIAGLFDEALGRERVRLVLKGLRRKRSSIKHTNTEDEVYDLILRRPCTFEQTIASLDIDREELQPIIEQLLERNRIRTVKSNTGTYYRATGN